MRLYTCSFRNRSSTWGSGSSIQAPRLGAGAEAASPKNQSTRERPRERPGVGRCRMTRLRACARAKHYTRTRRPRVNSKGNASPGASSSRLSAEDFRERAAVRKPPASLGRRLAGALDSDAPGGGGGDPGSPSRSRLIPKFKHKHRQQPHPPQHRPTRRPFFPSVSTAVVPPPQFLSVTPSRAASVRAGLTAMPQSSPHTAIQPYA